MVTGFQIAVIGGDKRLEYLSEQLEHKGYWISNAKESIGEADAVIAPVPFSKDKKYLFSDRQEQKLSIEEFCRSIQKGQMVFGGNIPEQVKKSILEKEAAFCDLMEIDEVAKKNAVATAEGSIAEAIRLSDRNLSESQCLVLGYGRCGKVLAEKLKGIGALVTVAARREKQCSKALEQGMYAFYLEELEEKIREYDFIFNTIPAMVLDAEKLCQVNRGAVIVDIASKPGGTDFDTCGKLKIPNILALGLPGKYSPKTSAEILLEAIMPYLPESQMVVTDAVRRS